MASPVGSVSTDSRRAQMLAEVERHNRLAQELADAQAATEAAAADHQAEVAELQNKLRKEGFDINEQGFGPQTDQAVRSFQAKNGLVVDGVVGDQTWGALEGFRGADALPPGLDLVSKFEAYQPTANLSDSSTERPSDGSILRSVLTTAAEVSGETVPAEQIQKLAATIESGQLITPANADPETVAAVALGLQMAATDQNVDVSKWFGFQPQESGKAELQSLANNLVDGMIEAPSMREAIEESWAEDTSQQPTRPGRPGGMKAV